ncbi:hypothetical protein LIER_36416 [Lithospermum erythrorhizon]|uniref:Uncharacterized protein n=1 Tax=Lithospermum erythrorhizon TaxID=34254 RepID=A0AAV3P5H8_LITER
MRPKISMDVYDHSGRITVGAIGAVAQEILQCTDTQLAETVNKDGGFHLQSIRDLFQDRMYLVLLRRSYSRRSDMQRRLLLVAYFDDTVPPLQESPSNNVDAGGSLDGQVVAHMKATDVHFTSSVTDVDPITGTPSRNVTTVSPLKRQLESVTLKTGSPAKRALFKDVDLADTLAPNVLTTAANVEACGVSDSHPKLTPK